MDPEEVSLAYDELHTKGKVLNFGVSNFTPYQIQNLKNNFSFPIKVNQIQFNLKYTVILDSGIEGFQNNINPHGINGILYESGKIEELYSSIQKVINMKDSNG